MIFHGFPNMQLRFFPFTSVIYHCCINMDHIFCKKEIIQKQKTHFIGYLVFTRKHIMTRYKELYN